MAHEDLLAWDSDELAHLQVLCEGQVMMGNTQPTERIIAIKNVLYDRGLWYCHHDETLEPLNHCTKCGRHYLYIENPEEPV